MVIQTTHTLCLMSHTLGMKYQGQKNNNNNEKIKELKEPQMRSWLTHSQTNNVLVYVRMYACMTERGVVSRSRSTLHAESQFQDNDYCITTSKSVNICDVETNITKHKCSRLLI